jgi:hypothetical protein
MALTRLGYNRGSGAMIGGRGVQGTGRQFTGGDKPGEGVLELLLLLSGAL